MTRFLLAAALFAAAHSHAEPPSVMTAPQAIHQNLLLRHPLPRYPREAKGATGNGLFLLRFDYETGHLREVHIAKSTGSATLDAAVVGALKQWRAKPRSLEVIRLPVTFGDASKI
jgi:TonB family protein